MSNKPGDPSTRSELERLDLTVPLGFEVALGCETLTPYVGFYLDDDETDLVYDNGFFEDAVDTDVWQQWLDQPVVRSALERIHQHFSQHDACYGLLLDIDLRRLYVGDRRRVRHLLSERVALGGSYRSESSRSFRKAG